MTVTEKAAYLKGLAEGLKLDADKPETKLFNAMIDLLDDLSLTVADLDDEVAVLNEQIDAVDEDLEDLEEFVYDEYEDCDCCDDDDYFEVKCPNCGEEICIDEDILEEGSINCPNCKELIEFDFDECDCCDGECDNDE